jgi:propionyl-CoA carboxylase beta chain
MEEGKKRFFVSYNDPIAVRVQKVTERKHEIHRMGGKVAISKLHEKGRLTARERLALLFDEGKFTEHFTFVESKNVIDRPTPADGVITGYGKVDGRHVVAYATDATLFSGACGEAGMRKIVAMYKLAGDMKVPVIAFIDSAGARLNEAMAATPPFVQSFFYQSIYSGVIPQITVVCGLCAAGQAYGPLLADFVIFTRHGGKMWLAGPRAAAEMSSSDVEQFGGADFHMQYSGSCDIIAEDDEESIKLVKDILSYCPSNWREKPPIIDKKTDEDDRVGNEIYDLVPDDPRQPLDMYKIISTIVDDNEFLEIKRDYGKSVITCFCRFNGQPCGIIASNPEHMGGALEPDSSDKFARFLMFCDSFGLPVITLVDCPAFVVGGDWEKKGVIRHGVKLISAFARATVPKIGVIIRKSYGGSTVVWGSKPNGADIVYAWPSAEVSPMGPDAAVSIIYNKQMKAIEDRKERRAFSEQKKREYFEQNVDVMKIASEMRWNVIDEIIDPRDTRIRIINGLDLTKSKDIDWLPKCKHPNPPQ